MYKNQTYEIEYEIVCVVSRGSETKTSFSVKSLSSPYGVIQQFSWWYNETNAFFFGQVAIDGLCRNIK